jgi:hypothetical protein
MQNSGVLAYQLIRRKDGGKIDKGQVMDSQDFLLDYPVMLFRQPKPLRERGIRVVAAGFGELMPVTLENEALQGKPSPAEALQTAASPTPGSPGEPPVGQPAPWSAASEQPGASQPLVRRQRFDTWQAQWQKESELIRAESDLELMHIRSRARATAQQDMTRVLSQILESPSSKEAMAMQLLQALEAAATDPSTHKLLPKDTLDMLQSLRQWLLIAGNEPGKQATGSTASGAGKPGGQG